MNEIDYTIYADDKVPYSTLTTTDEVIQSLKLHCMILFKYFPDNQIEASMSKCILQVNKTDEAIIIIEGTEIKNSIEHEKLLEIKIDTKLNFIEHLNEIISKASRKQNALLKFMPYMS